MHVLRGCVVAVFLCGAAVVCHADPAEYTCRVAAVTDGDTLKCLRPQSNQQIRIRLAETDAPEHGQPHWREARELLKQLVIGKDILVRPTGKKTWDRPVAYVYVDGIDVNETLLDAGVTWVSEQYGVSDTYKALQAKAKRDRSGLWSSGEPVPPWQWREQQRAQRKPGNAKKG